MNGCRFDLAHYVKILQTAKERRWTFRTFDGPAEDSDLFVRHDVDFDLEAALVVGQIEEALGVKATYLVMTDSELYNVRSPAGDRAVVELRKLGHHVGWHPRTPVGAPRKPDRMAASAFDPTPPMQSFPRVFAWHNPEPATIASPVGIGWQNVMADWFDPDTYWSDSQQTWRRGCPCKALAQDDSPAWMHLLVHPELWVYPGEDLAQTMTSMLEAQSARRRRQVADDRLDVQLSQSLVRSVLGEEEADRLRAEWAKRYVLSEGDVDRL